MSKKIEKILVIKVENMGNIQKEIKYIKNVSMAILELKIILSVIF